MAKTTTPTPKERMRLNLKLADNGITATCKGRAMNDY